MASKVISFRLDDDKLALLEQYQEDKESINQTAMRLLLGVLGVLGVEERKSGIQAVNTVDIEKLIEEKLASVGNVNTVDTVDIEQIINDKIAVSYAGVIDNFNQLNDQLTERLEVLEKKLIA